MTDMRTFTYRFVKKEVREGIVPRIVNGYIKKRRQVQAMMKGVKDPVQKVILDKRQWALKICANSMYGFFGAQSGKLSLIEAAMSITKKGREIITEAKKFCENKYGAVTVYGDTDSIMPSFGCKNVKEAYEVADTVTEELSSMYPGIIFELEKIMRIFCIGKKCYAAYKISRDGEVKTQVKDMLLKGIPLARRDKVPCLNETYLKVLLNILNFSPVYESFNILADFLHEFIETDEIPLKKMVMIKSLGSNYKSDTNFMKVFSDYLAEVGKPVQPGDRIEYAIVTTEADEKLLGRRARTTEMLMELDSKREEGSRGYGIDKEYYVKNLFTKSLETLFRAGYSKDLEKLTGGKKKTGYGRKKTKEFIGVDEPVTLIRVFIEEGGDYRVLKKWFRGQCK